ncbi:hypothetical protein VTI74DRAFT_9840 [Chaetomium olivicolor]
MAEAQKLEKPPVVGCLLDVSGSMRQALEAGRSDKLAAERFHAVLRLFGLNREARCPPVADLCSIASALLDMHRDDRTGHELLIELANHDNLAHITKYIRTKLSDDEARIVFAHLELHPERFAEFVNAIPEEEEINQARREAQSISAGLGAVIGCSVTFLGAAPLRPLAVAIPFAGGAAGGFFANKAADIVEDHAVGHSEALQLARSIWEEWWSACVEFVPRPVAEVVELLQRLQDQPGTNKNTTDGETSSRTLLEMIQQHTYGHTPMREALRTSLAAFTQHPNAKQRVLVLISDGNSTDGDPVPSAHELQKANVTLAVMYLTNDRTAPSRQLYDQPAESWNAGQRSLFAMAARIACATHPIPVLASVGWEVPSSGECALYVTVCSAELLEEFCTLLLSARFGSADDLLNAVGRLQDDAFINDEHVLAAVCRMALDRIVGWRGGNLTIEEIRTRILQEYPERSGGWNSEEVLRQAITWFPPLRFRQVDEEHARRAVLRRRPVLTRFRLSKEGWNAFCKHINDKETAKSVLTRQQMASYRSPPDGGGHAVVLVSCAPHSLTFLNSRGRESGNEGSFSVEDHTVLQWDTAEGPTPVRFYDVYWVESDLTESEKQAYNANLDETLRSLANEHRGIYELRARCPHCSVDSPIADFSGSIRAAVCPVCRQSFAPQPGHLMQALYIRAGITNLT